MKINYSENWLKDNDYKFVNLTSRFYGVENKQGWLKHIGHINGGNYGANAKYEFICNDGLYSLTEYGDSSATLYLLNSNVKIINYDNI